MKVVEPWQADILQVHCNWLVCRRRDPVHKSTRCTQIARSSSHLTCKSWSHDSNALSRHLHHRWEVVAVVGCSSAEYPQWNPHHLTHHPQSYPQSWCRRRHLQGCWDQNRYRCCSCQSRLLKDAKLREASEVSGGSFCEVDGGNEDDVEHDCFCSSPLCILLTRPKKKKDSLDQKPVNPNLATILLIQKQLLKYDDDDKACHEQQKDLHKFIWTATRYWFSKVTWCFYLMLIMVVVVVVSTQISDSNHPVSQ